VVSALLILIIALSAYIYLVNKPKNQETTSETKTIPITELKRENITKMTLTSEYQKLVFTKKDGKWIVNDINKPSYFDQDKIDDIAFSFSNLSAEKVVETNPKDLSKYGLENPKVTAEATFKDGTTVTFFLGDLTPTGNTYYLMKKGDERVFAVWVNHGENFSISPQKLLSVKFPEIDTTKITYVKLERKNQPTIEIEKVPESNEDASFKYYVKMWNMVKPYSAPVGVSSDKFSEFIENISSFSPDEIVGDDVYNTKYGLDKPTIEFVVKDEKNAIHLFVGNAKDSSTYYCRLANSNIVFVMENYKLEFLNNIKPFDLAEKFSYIVNIEYVKKVEVTMKDKKHTIIINKKLVKKAQNKDEQDEYAYTYLVDNKKIEEDTFKKFYQVLIGLLNESENDKKPEGKPEMTTTFYLENGTVDKVEYVPYNDDFYIVVRNGTYDFVISKEQVQKMFKDLEDLYAGKFKPEE